jgi:hypothetical protein
MVLSLAEHSSKTSLEGSLSLPGSEPSAFGGTWRYMFFLVAKFASIFKIAADSGDSLVADPAAFAYRGAPLTPGAIRQRLLFVRAGRLIRQCPADRHSTLSARPGGSLPIGLSAQLILELQPVGFPPDAGGLFLCPKTRGRPRLRSLTFR